MTDQFAASTKLEDLGGWELSWYDGSGRRQYRRSDGEVTISVAPTTAGTTLAELLICGPIPEQAFDDLLVLPEEPTG